MHIEADVTQTYIRYVAYQSHNTPTHPFLYHVILPWDTADVVVVVLEVNTHSLGILCSTIPALYIPHVLQHCLIPPSTRGDMVIIPLTIQVLVLKSRVPHANHVLQRHALTMIVTASCFCCIVERRHIQWWASIPNAFSTILRARESRYLKMRSPMAIFICPKGFIIQVRRAHASSPIKK